MRKPSKHLIVFCLSTLAGAANATTKDSVARVPFSPADVFQLSQADQVEISPDGAQIAYTRVTNDIMTDRALRAIWVIDVRTGAQTPIGTGESGTPRWSQDGSRIAFIATDPAGRSQIYVRWLRAGTTASVTSVSEAPGELAWSSDGRKIAFTMFVAANGREADAPLPMPTGAKWADPPKVYSRIFYHNDGQGHLRPGYTHVFVMNADGGATRQVTFGEFDDSGRLQWLRDGSKIVFVSNRTGDWELNPLNTDLMSVRLADGMISQLTTRNGPDEQPTISPDGKRIAYIGFDDRHVGFQNNKLSIMNADGSGVRTLSVPIDRSPEHPCWASDGKSLYAQFREHGATKVVRIWLDGRVKDIATGLAGNELDRPYSGGSFSLAKNGAIAFPWGDELRPADVGLAKMGEQRRMTWLNDELLSSRTLGKVTSLEIPASGNLPKIDAWRVLPPNFDNSQKYPLILEVHGGPFDSYGSLWSSDDQLYAAAGYIVLYANPRGSVSYGEDFANAIDKNYPGPDYIDLMRAVDKAVEMGNVDRDRLYVTGGSGGGTLTAWIVGNTIRFKAAVAQKPVINWSSEVLTSDSFAIMPKYWFGAMPWDDPMRYWRQSPLSLVGKVRTPTAIIVGEEDERTPASEAEQYYAALKLVGTPTELVRVPNASHYGFVARPSQLVRKDKYILDWFARFGGPKPLTKQLGVSAP